MFKLFDELYKCFANALGGLSISEPEKLLQLTSEFNEV